MNLQQMAQNSWKMAKFIALSIFRLHLIAAFRVLIAAIGWKSTYLIHANVPHKGGMTMMVTFVYTCKPWMTVYHLPEVASRAAEAAGHPQNNKNVTIISTSRIGNP